MIQLTRASENPIVTASQNSWENWLVFNPGVAMHGDTIYMLYRAKGKQDRISRFGLARSKDGIHFQREANSVYNGDQHTYEKQGVEDPRMVVIDNVFYIVYTAVTEDLQAEIDPSWNEQIAKRPQIALTATKDFYYYHEYGVIIPDVIGKDATLFPRKIHDKYYLLFRAGVGQTFLTTSADLKNWGERIPLFDKRSDMWDCDRVGVGAAPIETEKGWLLFYHGVDEHKTYRFGIMVFDRDDPTNILYRSSDPVFEPQADYETTGYIPNAIFTCGAIEMNGKYFVYYGAADQVICVATVEKSSILGLF